MGYDAQPDWVTAVLQVREPRESGPWGTYVAGSDFASIIFNLRAKWELTDGLHSGRVEGSIT